MRSVAVVLIATVLLIPAAFADTVLVTKAKITYLPLSATAQACKAPNRLGCTILQTEFFCNCAQTGGKWTLYPHAIVTPHVYTTAHDIMLHELEHVADVRTSLNEYAATLTIRTFDSELACTSFMVSEKSAFAQTLQNIQRVTTVRRDGEKYADRTEGR